MILASDVRYAKRALMDISNEVAANAPCPDEDRDASWGPVVLCEATTWTEFHLWLDENEGSVRRWAFEPFCEGSDQGRVVIHSTTASIHGATWSSIESSIILQTQKLGNAFDLWDTLEGFGSVTCTIGNYGQEPDCSLALAGLAVGGAVLHAADGCPFPNVVIDVAFKNESLASLRAKLVRWMDPRSTFVQIAIGIKIFVSSLRRVAILYQRGRPAQEVEFGLDCHGAAPLTIDFPLRSVYAGVGLPPALAGLNDPQISIDLIGLRQSIDMHVKNCLRAWHERHMRDLDQT